MCVVRYYLIKSYLSKIKRGMGRNIQCFFFFSVDSSNRKVTTLLPAYLLTLGERCGKGAEGKFNLSP